MMNGFKPIIVMPLIQITDPIVIVITGKVIAAKRPRVDKRGTHYAENYETWRKTAKQSLLAAIGNMPAKIARHFPLQGVKIELEFHGCALASSDLDNLEKGWLDVLVKAGIITGDSVRRVNETNPKWFESDYPATAILIYQNHQPVSKVDPRLLKRPEKTAQVNPTAGNKYPVKKSFVPKRLRVKKDK